MRQAIAEKTKRGSGLDITAAQVLVTNGGKQATYAAFATMLDPGDEVIMPALSNRKRTTPESSSGAMAAGPTAPTQPRHPTDRTAA